MFFSKTEKIVLMIIGVLICLSIVSEVIVSKDCTERGGTMIESGPPIYVLVNSVLTPIPDMKCSMPDSPY